MDAAFKAGMMTVLGDQRLGQSEEVGERSRQAALPAQQGPSKKATIRQASSASSEGKA
jgi:hypothetical protein